MAARQQLNIDLDADVALILRSHAAEAHVGEGEIVDRAIRAYDLHSLVTRIGERSDLDEDTAQAPVREELHAARSERNAALDAPRRRGRERVDLRGAGQPAAGRTERL